MTTGFVYLKLTDGGTAVVPSDTVASIEKNDAGFVVNAAGKAFECESVVGEAQPLGDEAKAVPDKQEFSIVEDVGGGKSVVVGQTTNIPVPPGGVKRRVDEKGAGQTAKDDLVFALPVIFIEEGRVIRFSERPRPCDCEFPTLLAVSAAGELTFVTEKEAETGQWSVLCSRDGFPENGLGAEEWALDKLVATGVNRKYNTTTDKNRDEGNEQTRVEEP